MEVKSGLLFTPPEVSLLLCGLRRGAATEGLFASGWQPTCSVTEEVVISDLLTRGYVITGKKILIYSKFILTEKAKLACKVQTLRPYELKLFEEFGEKGIWVEHFLEGRRGFKSLKYMDHLINWGQREKIGKFKKSLLSRSFLLTEKGEELAEDWRRRLEQLKNKISKTYSLDEDQGRRIMSRYLPWIRIMEEIYPKEKPRWMRRGWRGSAISGLALLSMLVTLIIDQDMGRFVASDILDARRSIALERSVKYLQPEDIMNIMSRGEFDEDEELKAYYPEMYPPTSLKPSQTFIEDKRFCISCGEKISLHAKFCPKCGAEQD